MTRPQADDERRIKLSFEDAEALRALCGDMNKRLKLIERAVGASIHVRGNEISIHGGEHEVELARGALEQLYGLAVRGRTLSSDDVVRAVKVLQADHGAALDEIFSDTVLVPRVGRPIAPKGINQKHYVDAVRRHDMVFAIGPAGTGKTYLAMAMAVRMLLDREIKRIVLTRPAVEAGERLGFLPGTLEEKINPYLRPLYDALHDMLDYNRVRRLMEQDAIEVAPLAFMRGRTLSDSFIILDEAQNSTREQMKMFLTRLGFGSKAVINGDMTQSDLPSGSRSGLVEAVRILGNASIPGLAVCRFTEADVVRHPLVQDIIRAYEGQAQPPARAPEPAARPEGDEDDQD